MAYTDEDAVRLMTNLVVSDISDVDITSLIAEATAQVNSDILVKVTREPVLPIDSVRDNKINGTTTTFYVRNWEGKYLGDLDNDGVVDTNDVIVYQVSADGQTESVLTVSAIDDEDCSFTLSSAPSSGVRLYVTYAFGWVRSLTGSVDPKLKLATTLLTAAYCYAKITWGRPPSSRYGSQSITRDMNAFDNYYRRYMELTKQIQQIGGLSLYGENENKI